MKIITIFRKTFKLYSNNGEENMQRSEEIKKIGDEIETFAKDEKKSNFDRKFENACVVAFEVCIREYKKEGKGFDILKDDHFISNLDRPLHHNNQGEIHMSDNLEEAIELTRRRINNGTATKDKETYSRNIRQIIHIHNEISNGIVQKALDESGILKILKGDSDTDSDEIS